MPTNDAEVVLTVLTCAGCVLQPATMEAALADAFPEANRLLKHTPGLDADLSGSTGIVAVSATQHRMQMAGMGRSLPGMQAAAVGVSNR